LKTTSYHTCLKELVRHGLLPRAYATKIHRTTIWRWKNEPADKYLGGELYDLELLGAFIQRKESTAIMRSYLKMALTLKLIVGKCSEFKRKLE
jgi:hypothetical protein